jgi:hypothetical protein
MDIAKPKYSPTTEVGMRVLICLLCAATLLLPSASHGEKYAGEFMALGGGARAMGMGGAFVALANDVTATFWNPAGIADFSHMLASPRGWQMSLMHSERFGDLIDYNFAAAAFPISGRRAGWGLTLIHMGIQDIRVIPWSSDLIGNSDGDAIFEPRDGEYLNFDYSEYPFENVNDYALFLSYAQTMDFGSLGASMKFIRNDQVTDVTSFGIGLDLGFIKRDLWRDMLVGVKLQDATGTYITWSTGEREFIYPTLKIGVAYPFELESVNSKLVIAAEGDFRHENRKSVSQFWIGRSSADFHFGVELAIRDVVFLRGGLDMDRPTAGAGFLLDDFGPWGATIGIDYALLIHDVFDTTHRVSLILGQ